MGRGNGEEGWAYTCILKAKPDVRCERERGTKDNPPKISGLSNWKVAGTIYWDWTQKSVHYIHRAVRNESTT